MLIASPMIYYVGPSPVPQINSTNCRLDSSLDDLVSANTLPDLQHNHHNNNHNSICLSSSSRSSDTSASLADLVREECSLRPYAQYYDDQDEDDAFYADDSSSALATNALFTIAPRSRTSSSVHDDLQDCDEPAALEEDEIDEVVVQYVEQQQQQQQQQLRLSCGDSILDPIAEVDFESGDYGKSLIRGVGCTLDSNNSLDCISTPTTTNSDTANSAGTSTTIATTATITSTTIATTSTIIPTTSTIIPTTFTSIATTSTTNSTTTGNANNTTGSPYYLSRPSHFEHDSLNRFSDPADRLIAGCIDGVRCNTMDVVNSLARSSPPCVNSVYPDHVHSSSDASLNCSLSYRCNEHPLQHSDVYSTIEIPPTCSPQQPCNSPSSSPTRVWSSLPDGLACGGLADRVVNTRNSLEDQRSHILYRLHESQHHSYVDISCVQPSTQPHHHHHHHHHRQHHRQHERLDNTPVCIAMQSMVQTYMVNSTIGDTASATNQSLQTTHHNLGKQFTLSSHPSPLFSNHPSDQPSNHPSNQPYNHPSNHRSTSKNTASNPPIMAPLIQIPKTRMLTVNQTLDDSSVNISLLPINEHSLASHHRQHRMHGSSPISTVCHDESYTNLQVGQLPSPPDTSEFDCRRNLAIGNDLVLDTPLYTTTLTNFTIEDRDSFLSDISESSEPATDISIDSTSDTDLPCTNYPLSPPQECIGEDSICASANAAGDVMDFLGDFRPRTGSSSTPSTKNTSTKVHCADQCLPTTLILADQPNDLQLNMQHHSSSQLPTESLHSPLDCNYSHSNYCRKGSSPEKDEFSYTTSTYIPSSNPSFAATRTTATTATTITTTTTTTTTTTDTLPHTTTLPITTTIRYPFTTQSTFDLVAINSSACSTILRQSTVDLVECNSSPPDSPLPSHGPHPLPSPPSHPPSSPFSPHLPSPPSSPKQSPLSSPSSPTPSSPSSPRPSPPHTHTLSSATLPCEEPTMPTCKSDAIFSRMSSDHNVKIVINGYQGDICGEFTGNGEYSDVNLQTHRGDNDNKHSYVQTSNLFTRDPLESHLVGKDYKAIGTDGVTNDTVAIDEERVTDAEMGKERSLDKHKGDQQYSSISLANESNTSSLVMLSISHVDREFDPKIHGIFHSSSYELGQ